MSNLTPWLFYRFPLPCFSTGREGILLATFVLINILKVNKSKIERKPNKNIQVVATEEKKNFQPRMRSGNFPTISAWKIGESPTCLSIQSRDFANICWVPTMCKNTLYAQGDKSYNNMKIITGSATSWTLINAKHCAKYLFNHRNSLQRNDHHY